VGSGTILCPGPTLVSVRAGTTSRDAAVLNGMWYGGNHQCRKTSPLAFSCSFARRNGRRHPLSIRAPCHPFRDGGASTLSVRRRTAWPLPPRCRTSCETGSRHARATPFKVCGCRPVATSPTPPLTSWLSIPAVAHLVARVVPPPGARTCRHRGRQRHGATQGWSSISAAIWDDRRRQFTGDGGGEGHGGYWLVPASVRRPDLCGCGSAGHVRRHPAARRRHLRGRRTSPPPENGTS